jgi:hypothetical protein
VKHRFRTEPEAADELQQAALWYEQRRAELGREFLEAVDRALEFIDRFPQAGTSVPEVLPDLPVRLAPVRGFPFHIVYLELPATNMIHILAFAHDRRSPGYWRLRAPH